MELRDLRAYAAVVELGSMTQAAKRLHIVQSSVSQAIKRLEVAFGMELLERRSDGVRPTAAGEELARHTRRVLGRVSRLEADMASYRSTLRGSVGIGTATTLSPIVLASLIRRVDRELPGVSLHVEEGVTGDLVDAVRLGRLDLALVVLPLDPDGLELVTTGVLELSYILPATHPLAQRPEISCCDLERESWISFPQANPARTWVEQSCREAGFRPVVTAEVETMNQLKAFVEAGHGISLLPRQVVELELLTKRLCAVPATPPRPIIEHGYLYDPDMEPEPAVTSVRALADAELRAVPRPAGANGARPRRLVRQG